jgi:ribosomal protein S9
VGNRPKKDLDCPRSDPARSGKLIVNKKELDSFFSREQDRKAVVAPLKIVHAEKAFDISLTSRVAARPPGGRGPAGRGPGR